MIILTLQRYKHDEKSDSDQGSNSNLPVHQVDDQGAFYGSPHEVYHEQRSHVEALGISCKEVDHVTG